MGSTCLNAGCIPAKCLLHTAELVLSLIHIFVYPDEESIAIMKNAAYNTWMGLEDEFDPVAMERLMADYLPEEIS